MIRVENYKYIYYVNMPAMLFDLQADPEEMIDLGQDPAYQDVLINCEKELRKIVDPELADIQAKADQHEKIIANGGKDAILKRGGFRFSPPPGVQPSRYS